MAASGLGELTQTLSGLQANLQRVNKDAGHRIGRAGNEAVKDQYTRLFGGDHKFSGARGSKTAGRKATVRYRVEGDQVNVYPSGDPIYIRMKGRGRTRIYPRNRPKKGHWSALRMPDGSLRYSVRSGALKPDPGALDPAVRKLASESARLMSEAVDVAIRRAL